MNLYFNAIIKYETNTEYSWIGDDNIMYHVCKKDSYHDLNAAIENVSEAELKLKGKKLAAVTDIRNIGKITPNAREYYGSKHNEKNILSLALITDNSITKVLANFFMRINKPAFPTKLFTDENEAINWAKNQSKKIRKQIAENSIY